MKIFCSGAGIQTSCISLTPGACVTIIAIGAAAVTLGWRFWFFSSVLKIVVSVPWVSSTIS
jgi:hypothetical protein